MNLNAAVVGLGNIGFLYDYLDSEKIQTHTKAFQKHPHTTLVAGIDANQKARELFTQFTKTNSYSSLEEVTDLDIISIASPTSHHLDLLLKSIEKKPKLVILEKPVVQTKEEYKKVKEILKDLEVPVFVNYIRRVDISTQFIKNKIKSGDLGNLQKADITYNRGLFNIASHFIDFISYIFGDIEGFSKTSSALEVSNIKGDFQVDFNLEVKGSLISFKSLKDHKSHHSQQKYYFDKGTLEIDTQSNILLNGETIKHDYKNYQLNVLNHVIDHIRSGTPLLSDLNSGLATTKICLDIINSD